MSVEFPKKTFIALSVGSGPNFTKLANDVSDAIFHAAQDRGMEIDEAVCCAVQVIADYARSAYGPRYLRRLAKLLVERGKDPIPDVEWHS